MVILDTDHLSVLERANDSLGQRLRHRLADLDFEEVVTTIISFEEQTRGWMARIEGSHPGSAGQSLPEVESTT